MTDVYLQNSHYQAVKMGIKEEREKSKQNIAITNSLFIFFVVDKQNTFSYIIYCG